MNKSYATPSMEEIEIKVEDVIMGSIDIDGDQLPTWPGNEYGEN